MPHVPRTDFAQFSLAQLTHMLYDSDPATGTNAAQTWDATGRMLHEQAHSLERRLGDFNDKWVGSASDEYKRMVGDLIDGIRRVAETSLKMRDLTYDAVDSLTKARAAMPAPVDIPYVSPATLALAVTPLTVDASTPAPVVAQMQAEQARAMSAVQAQQEAFGAASAAHTQAVVVMHTLASNYSGAQDSFPPAPDAVPPAPNGTAPGSVGGMTGPAIVTPTNLTGTGLPGANLQPGGPAGGLNQNGSDGLFGDLFTVGLAAVAAASAGKFLLPQSSLLKTGANAKGATPGSATGAKVAAGETAGVLGARVLAGKVGKGGVGGMGTTGGSNASFGGVGGVDGSAANVATGAANSLGSAESAALNEFSGSAGLAQSAAASAGRGGMMPMMPMSGMGAGMGDAAARRIPAWLIETEDVWGASAPVSPGVIGGDL